jgi:ring-1,2-phenylacetyl-CoA epoxidase subunit PaaA
MSTAVPFCESIGIDVPAHHDAEKDEYVIDCPFPQQFDEEEKRWLTEEGEITWDDVLVRWRRRGPANEELVEMIQRGRLQRAALVA